MNKDMGPSLKLSPGQSVLEVANASRFALEQFLALEPNDKLALSRWLVGPYRRAVAEVPKRIRTIGRGEVDTSEISTIVANAQVLLEHAIDAASKPGAETLLALLPSVGIDVMPIEDADGARGFASMDIAHTKLAARVLSLLVADYLTRPEHYLAANEVESARRRPTVRIRAAG